MKLYPEKNRTIHVNEEQLQYDQKQKHQSTITFQEFLTLIHVSATFVAYQILSHCIN